jgi:hypothetical protein
MPQSGRRRLAVIGEEMPMPAPVTTFDQQYSDPFGATGHESGVPTGRPDVSTPDDRAGIKGGKQ